jgi:carbonic anhydrase
MMLSCSDHGTAPDNVSFAGPDRFFIIQHLAATIPSVSESNNDTTFADTEFAFELEEPKHVIVCGHLACGVIASWLEAKTIDTGGFKTRFQRTTQAAVDAAYPNLRAADRLEMMIYEHVLFQLENLQSHELIRLGTKSRRAMVDDGLPL